MREVSAPHVSCNLAAPPLVYVSASRLSRSVEEGDTLSLFCPSGLIDVETTGANDAAADLCVYGVLDFELGLGDDLHGITTMLCCLRRGRGAPFRPWKKGVWAVAGTCVAIGMSLVRF